MSFLSLPAKGLYGSKLLIDTWDLVKLSFFGPIGNKMNEEINSGSIYDYAQKKAQEMQIKKRIIIYEEQTSAMSSFGNNFLSTKIGFTLPNDLTPEVRDNQFSEKINLTDAEINFFITHELAHIKNNDLITWLFIPIISSLVTYIGIDLGVKYVLSNYLISSGFVSNTFTLLENMNPYLAIISALIVQIISKKKILHWREFEADKMACKYSDTHAINMGISGFAKMNQYFIQRTKDLDEFARGIVQADMNETHPPYLERIECLQTFIKDHDN